MQGSWRCAFWNLLCLFLKHPLWSLVLLWSLWPEKGSQLSSVSWKCMGTWWRLKRHGARCTQLLSSAHVPEQLVSRVWGKPGESLSQNTNKSHSICYFRREGQQSPEGKAGSWVSDTGTHAKCGRNFKAIQGVHSFERMRKPRVWVAEMFWWRQQNWLKEIEIT